MNYRLQPRRCSERSPQLLDLFIKKLSVICFSVSLHILPSLLFFRQIPADIGRGDFATGLGQGLWDERIGVMCHCSDATTL
jgi:hypothetical protein